MSYLPPQEAGFFEAIQVYFTEVTDRVVLFGARDRALLEQWKEEGRPAQVVCRGIREALARRDDELRSLVQCEPYVDEKWKESLDRKVGSHDAASSVAARSTRNNDGGQPSNRRLYDRVRQLLQRAGEQAQHERWRQAYRKAWRAMQRQGTGDGEFSFDDVRAVDDALVGAYLEVLNDEELRIVERCVDEVSESYMRQMSAQARRQHLQTLQKRTLVERFGLLDLLAELSR